jgi:signal transduction histidine kinase
LRKDGSIVALEVAISEAIPGKVFTGILRDISERKQLEREVTEIAATEQRRIGQELHDGVSQELTGLTLMAAALLERLDGEAPAAQPLGRRIVEGLGQVQKRVRHVSHGLIPVEVDAEGLRAALEDFAARISQQAGITCAFRCPSPVFVADTVTATHLYHIVQEATNNALRHARARRIEIRLHARSDALVMSVSDDGIGLQLDANPRDGVGLRLMNYRAGLIGAALHVGPAESKGTVVTCTLPNLHNK